MRAHDYDLWVKMRAELIAYKIGVDLKYAKTIANKELAVYVKREKLNITLEEMLMYSKDECLNILEKNERRK